MWDEEETQKNGTVMLVDMDGLPMQLLKFIAPKDAIICARLEEVIVDRNYPKCECARRSRSVSHSLTHTHTHTYPNPHTNTPTHT